MELDTAASNKQSLNLPKIRKIKQNFQKLLLHACWRDVGKLEEVRTCCKSRGIEIKEGFLQESRKERREQTGHFCSNWNGNTWFSQWKWTQLFLQGKHWSRASIENWPQTVLFCTCRKVAKLMRATALSLLCKCKELKLLRYAKRRWEFESLFVLVSWRNLKLLYWSAIVPQCCAGQRPANYTCIYIHLDYDVYVVEDKTLW